MCHRNGSSLRQSFATVKTPGLLDLLEGMLQFNPDFRFTASECLQHSVFDKIRNQAKEKGAPEMVELPCFADGMYDYHRKRASKFSAESLFK